MRMGSPKLIRESNCSCTKWSMIDLRVAASSRMQLMFSEGTRKESCRKSHTAFASGTAPLREVIAGKWYLLIPMTRAKRCPCLRMDRELWMRSIVQCPGQAGNEDLSSRPIGSSDVEACAYLRLAVMPKSNPRQGDWLTRPGFES